VWIEDEKRSGERQEELSAAQIKNSCLMSTKTIERKGKQATKQQSYNKTRLYEAATPQE